MTPALSHHHVGNFRYLDIVLPKTKQSRLNKDAWSCFVTVAMSVNVCPQPLQVIRFVVKASTTVQFGLTRTSTMSL